MTTEIQKTEDASPESMIKLAIESNADLEKVEKLLELKERFEANEARKVFASDFSVVQANMGAVIKTAVNPQTHSNYAKLEGVIEVSKPVYTKQGFSIIFYEGKTEVPENIRVYADVLHKSGHKETYHFDVPLDGVGIKGNANMTKIHGKASSVSYGRRYLLCMIWNIPTQDDDGNGNVEKKSTVKQLTDAEDKIMEQVLSQIKVPEGFELDKKRVKSIHLSTRTKTLTENLVGSTANYFNGLKNPAMFIKIDPEAGMMSIDEVTPDPNAKKKCLRCTAVFDSGKECPNCGGDDIGVE